MTTETVTIQDLADALINVFPHSPMNIHDEKQMLKFRTSNIDAIQMFSLSSLLKENKADVNITHTAFGISILILI